MERLRAVFYRKPGPWFTIVFIPYRKRLHHDNFQYSVFYCNNRVSVAFLADFMKNSFTSTMFILVMHHWCCSMTHTLKWFISLRLRYTACLRWHLQIFSFRSLSYSVVLYYSTFYLYPFCTYSLPLLTISLLLSAPYLSSEDQLTSAASFRRLNDSEENMAIYSTRWWRKRCRKFLQP